MSSRWMREIVYDINNSGSVDWWRKAIPLWIRYVMNYSLQVENCGAGRSYVSTEKNDTDGVFSGSDYLFTTTVHKFASSDVGKYLIVRCDSAPKNGGIYLITKFITDQQIQIDFRAGYQEYPDSATGALWWICGPTYQIPAIGEYVRLQSRHSTGWALEWTHGDWAYYGQAVRVAPNGNWSDKIIGTFYGAWPTGDSRDYTGFWTAYSGGAGRWTFWAEGDFENCEWLRIWDQALEQGSQLPGMIHAISIERVSPVESGHSDDELIVLRGGAIVNTGEQRDTGDRNYDSVRARGRTWSVLLNGEVTGYVSDYSYSGFVNGFAMSIKEPNWRRDGKLEAFVGSPYLADENNAAGAYQLLGFLKGHWTIPNLPTNQFGGSWNHNYGRDTHRMVPMNMNGDKDLLMLCDGFCIAWCGLSVRGQG